MSKSYTSFTEEMKMLRGQAERSAVFTFGRFQPPTTGHMKLVEAVKSTAAKRDADPFVFPSRSKDDKKNPLTPDDKIYYMRKAFGRGVRIINDRKATTIFKAMEILVEMGYTNLTLVVGSDRVGEFTRTITPYVDEMGLTSFEVVSAGERDPAASGVKGMSASKLRAAAAANDFNAFRAGVPGTLRMSDVETLFTKLRKSIRLTEAVGEFSFKRPTGKAKKIVLLTGYNPLSKSGLFRTAERLRDECKKLGVEFYAMHTFNERGYATHTNEDGTMLLVNSDGSKVKISPKDTVVLVRGDPSRRVGTNDQVREFEDNGFFVINTADSIDRCSDKYRATRELQKNGLPVPRTEYVHQAEKEAIMLAHKRVGGKYPVVLKTIRGSKGRGVMIASDEKALVSIVQAIHEVDEYAQLIVQEFLPIDGDIRILVLHDKVLGAMKRKQGKNEFRANYDLGGSVSKIDIDERVSKLAVKAASAMGCYYAGVDIAIRKDTNEPVIIEVNSSPGTEGIETATDKNLVKDFLLHVIDKENWKRSPSTIVASYEVIKIEGFGPVLAKFDTGNGAQNAIHADEYSIDDANSMVTWKHKGKTFQNKVIGMIELVQGAFGGKKETRPVIELDIEFMGKTFTKQKFSLDDRSEKNTVVLMGTPTMREMGVVVIPGQRYRITSKQDLEEAARIMKRKLSDKEKATEDGIDFSSPPEEGTDEIVRRYKKMTPGELNELFDDYFKGLGDTK